MRGRYRITLVLGLVLVGATAALAGGTQATAAPTHRTCGLPEGEGAFHEITTVGVTCRVAEKISNRAIHRFCDQRHGCRYGMHTPPTLIRKGAVVYRGWRCRIRTGYEFSEASCRRGSMHFRNTSGA